MSWSKNITSYSKVSTNYSVPTISASVFIFHGVSKEKHSLIVTRHSCIQTILAEGVSLKPIKGNNKSCHVFICKRGPTNKSYN